jgi:hypothetical protein
MFLTRTISTASKLGYVYATYSPVALTCSDSCPLKAGGCFAREGRVGMVQRRIQRELGATEPTAAWGDVCAELEASEIRDAIARRRDLAPLRIHVSGDADTDWRAQRLASAARGWRHPVWTYTHSWRHVARASWGSVSALASVETLQDAVAALELGARDRCRGAPDGRTRHGRPGNRRAGDPMSPANAGRPMRPMWALLA